MKPSFRLFFRFAVFFETIFYSVWCGAAACCGGGVATPTLILGDDKAQISASLSYSVIQDDVYDSGLWHTRDTRETNQTLSLDYAQVFWDRWQAGILLPVVTRSRMDESSSGLGDITANLGYEYLTDWDYSPWRPKALGFLQLTLPTGRAIQESEDPYQLDSRGRGFFAFGGGTALSKVIGKYDILSSFEVHRSFARSFSNQQMSGTLHPGWGGTLTVAGGYNWAKLRLGSALSWTYEDPINSVGSVSTLGSAQRFGTVTLALSYLLPQEWSATLSYADQALVGDPTNTTLSRSAMLLFQKRFQR